MNVEPTGTNQAVTGAIREAARMTGADFKYLLATAQVESSLNPNARASTSSARGLFQFTEQTWLTTVKEQGAGLGYGPYANAISRQPSGDYAVADPRMNDAVMNLRSDPAANALMAGAFTKVNASRLAARLGRDATEGELYIAHFLGATGASRLIGLTDTKPSTPAAAVFPGAARANPTIFYDERRLARSANEVYRVLVGRYDGARGGPASAPVLTATESVKPGAHVAFAPDTALMTETYAAAARLSSPAAATHSGPIFQGLFRTGAVPEAVAPVVSALWAAPTPVPPAERVPVKGEPAAPTGDAGDLGLFQDKAPDARSLFRGRV